MQVTIVSKRDVVPGMNATADRYPATYNLQCSGTNHSATHRTILMRARIIANSIATRSANWPGDVTGAQGPRRSGRARRARSVQRRSVWSSG